MAVQANDGGIWLRGDRNGIVTWDAADAADTYAAYEHQKVLADIILSAEGIAATGVAIEIHGSVNGTDYYQLRDIDANLISLAADGIVEVRSAPPFFKPVNTGGAGGTLIVALHLAKVYA